MSGRRRLLMLFAVAAAGAVAAGIAIAGKGDGNDKTFVYAIGLWGDLPYSAEQANPGIPNLIADMNNSDIAFSVHDGDLKAGNGASANPPSANCDDALYTTALGWFNSLDAPAIFTPGDNDWTDCDRVTNGSFNSLERLDHERQLFFDTNTSLGKKTLVQEVQSAPLCKGYLTATTYRDVPCVENRRWTFKEVTYATVNVQGTCNNFCSSGAGDPAGDPIEGAARSAAAIQWLKDTFAEAEANGSAGVMIVWQADPGFDTSGYQGGPKRDPRTLQLVPGSAPADGIQEILTELRAQTIAFKRPVVLVHGDSHYFMVDKPFRDSAGRQIENFTRLETFGDNAAFGLNAVHWVKVLVDPQSRDVFAFQPQTVPANRVAVPVP